MDLPNITTDQAAGCLRILQAAARPMTAAEVASHLGIAGNHETQRRHIRELVKHLRDNGSMIVATLQDGYWLTADADLWKEYNEHKAIDAKRILGETHYRKKMLADTKGQGML